MLGFLEGFMAFYRRAKFITESGVECEPVQEPGRCSLSQVTPKWSHQRSQREENQPCADDKNKKVKSA